MMYKALWQPETTDDPAPWHAAGLVDWADVLALGVIALRFRDHSGALEYGGGVGMALCALSDWGYQLECRSIALGIRHGYNIGWYDGCDEGCKDG